MTKCDYENCQGVEDESVDFDWGSYHESCWDSIQQAEMEYWYKQVGHLPKLTTSDLDAYEAGSAKYIDTERRLEMQR